MKIHKLVISSVLMALVFLGGCTYEKDEMAVQDANCSLINAAYAADVSPIMQSSCAINSACHGVGSINGPGELLTYPQVQAASELIKIEVESREMPLGSTLSQAEIDKISCWVRSGSPNN